MVKKRKNVLAYTFCFPKVMRYRKSSIKPPRGLFITNTFEGGGGGLINLAKSVVSVLHEKTKYEMEKLNYKKLEVMQPRINNK